MDLYARLIKPLLFSMDAEKAHTIALKAMALGNGSLLPLITNKSDHRKNQSLTLAGIEFPNRVGLAAGFDTNAALVDIWPRLGFGHIEIGTITPKPQEGNPKPRLFRMPADAALINRMGLNNEGVEIIRARLELYRPDSTTCVIGGNIGKSKETSEDNAFKDYLLCMEGLHEVVDYFTVNISSPNAVGLRNMQNREPLWKLLGNLQDRNQQFGKPRPIFIKIAPDMDEYQLADMVLVAKETNCAGIVATNSTTSRNNLITPVSTVGAFGQGELSGHPLKERAAYFNQLIARMIPPDMVLIATGGIMQAEDAEQRFQNGAHLVQLYTGFVYKGPKLINECINLLHSN